MDPKDRLIIALDVDTKEKALAIVEKLKNYVRLFKVGFELFSSCGPEIVEEVSRKGCGVFLDLKYHDIPNTVSKAAASVTKLGTFMINVHALGGYDMMKKTADAVRVQAARLKIPKPKVIAVTILTSMDEIALKSVGIRESMGDEVLCLARLAQSAGLDGIVASPAEIKLLRVSLGREFLIVTPGVRPVWASAGDQKRIATPKDAIADGADYIVVGRPVTDSLDMVEAVRKITEEIQS